MFIAWDYIPKNVQICDTNKALLLHAQSLKISRMKNSMYENETTRDG